jgi:hypothetical protein
VSLLVESLGAHRWRSPLDLNEATLTIGFIFVARRRKHMKACVTKDDPPGMGSTFSIQTNT